MNIVKGATGYFSVKNQSDEPRKLENLKSHLNLVRIVNHYSILG